MAYFNKKTGGVYNSRMSELSVQEIIGLGQPTLQATPFPEAIRSNLSVCILIYYIYKKIK
jgi:hypothetical protein